MPRVLFSFERGGFMISRTLRVVVGVAAALMISSAASATPIHIAVTFSGNDCNGVFGNPSGGGQSGVICDVGTALTTSDTTVSPWIIKFNANGSFAESNTTNFPSITGSEFTFNTTTGAWTYTPGLNDPVIRFWVNKAGDGFTLNWFVEGTTVGTTCNSPAYNYDCLNLALPITAGFISLTSLSHFTFYDTSVVINPNCPTGDCPLPEVPEPTTLALLGTGLAAAAFGLRRATKKS